MPMNLTRGCLRQLGRTLLVLALLVAAVLDALDRREQLLAAIDASLEGVRLS